MKQTRRSVDTYLHRLPEPDRTTMLAVDRIIAAAMPEASRRLWTGTFWGGTSQEIIGYGDITQPRPRGEAVEWFLIGLARQKRHISLYVNAVEGDRYLSHLYAERLGKVKVGAASIAFRRLEDLDPDALQTLAVHAHRLAGK